jgi:hypothetical protein
LEAVLLDLEANSVLIEPSMKDAKKQLMDIDSKIEALKTQELQVNISYLRHHSLQPMNKYKNYWPLL